MNLRLLAEPGFVRGLVWAAVRLPLVRRTLRRDGLSATTVPVPSISPARAAAAERGAISVLARARGTCLERALIRQAIRTAADETAPDVVIGVAAPSGGFRAHAWLDGEEQCHTRDLTELTRRAPADRG